MSLGHKEKKVKSENKGVEAENTQVNLIYLIYLFIYISHSILK